MKDSEVAIYKSGSTRHLNLNSKNLDDVIRQFDIKRTVEGDPYFGKSWHIPFWSDMTFDGESFRVVIERKKIYDESQNSRVFNGMPKFPSTVKQQTKGLINYSGKKYKVQKIWDDNKLDPETGFPLFQKVEFIVKIKETKMKITNIFFSVQGEGPSLGKPSVFIRLTGCNKTCSFCDTKYSWKEGKEMTIDEIIEQVKSYNSSHITITGGEPLLQQKELIKLMEKLLKTNMFYHFEIETNGTIAPTKRLAELTDLFIVSPKFQDFTYATIFSDINELAERTNVIFKYVVDKRGDMKEILKFEEQFNHRSSASYLMPCSTTVEEHNSRLPMIIDFAKEFGFIVSPRLHILAYGNKRGV